MLHHQLSRRSRAHVTPFAIANIAGNFKLRYNLDLLISNLVWRYFKVGVVFLTFCKFSLPKN